MSDVTRILSQIEQGDPAAAEQLLPLVYDELRKLAAIKLAQENPGQTLQATALVHEVYVRLVDGQQEQNWNSCGHFFGAAAEAMRRTLVEIARRKSADKHGGDRERVEIVQDEIAGSDCPTDDWLLLDDALSCLERDDPAAAQLAKLRLFAGLSIEKAGEAMGLSRATAFRHWTYARAWLQARLRDFDRSWTR
jgi:RNA polymerase sigma factor (TIGR02999 family)